MTEKTGKQGYVIFQTVMQDKQHHLLSEEYREKLDILQSMVTTFSKEQWKAIDDYLDVSLRVHHEMMDIALTSAPQVNTNPFDILHI